MNERTLELALQAGLKKAHGADREYMGDFDWREFAELIVRECISVADHSNVTGKSIIGDRIKEHFGVEE
jgi:hypothetical protein